MVDTQMLQGGLKYKFQYLGSITIQIQCKHSWQTFTSFRNSSIQDNVSTKLAIPSQKLFIFGGQQAEYQEGTARAFGQYVNTSALIDMGTLRWTTFASDPDTYPNIPSPREYASMAYDERDRRLIIFGGWNNGWFGDLYTLNVAKIVGPSYAIVSSDPALGQLSGNVELKIPGRGFKELSISVLFTQGNKPVDAPGKLTLQVPGTFVSETELTCVTPNFE